MYRLLSLPGGLKAIWALLSILLIPATCQALSCYPLQDHFFLQCQTGTCTGLFRAREIPTAGACARRTVVEPLQDAEARLFTPMLINSTSGKPVSGYFHILLANHFYGSKPVTANELKDAMSQDGLQWTRLEKIEWMGNSIQADSLKQEWQNRESMELRNYWMRQFLDYGGFAACLAILFFSVKKFRRWVIGRRSGESGLLLLAMPLAIQMAIFTLTLSPWIYFFSGAIFVTLIPLVVFIIWCYELLFFLINCLLNFHKNKQLKKTLNPDRTSAL